MQPIARSQLNTLSKTGNAGSLGRNYDQAGLIFLVFILGKKRPRDPDSAPHAITHRFSHFFLISRAPYLDPFWRITRYPTDKLAHFIFLKIFPHLGKFSISQRRSCGLPITSPNLHSKKFPTFERFLIKRPGTFQASHEETKSISATFFHGHHTPICSY